MTCALDVSIVQKIKSIIDKITVGKNDVIEYEPFSAKNIDMFFGF